MARITVEDCLDKVDNRFDLVLLAAKRARQLSTGAAEPTVDWENDKETVVALREIAAGTFSEADLIKKQIEDEQEKAELENQGSVSEDFI